MDACDCKIRHKSQHIIWPRSWIEPQVFSILFFIAKCFNLDSLFQFRNGVTDYWGPLFRCPKAKATDLKKAPTGCYGKKKYRFKITKPLNPSELRTQKLLLRIRRVKTEERVCCEIKICTAIGEYCWRGNSHLWLPVIGGLVVMMTG